MTLLRHIGGYGFLIAAVGIAAIYTGFIQSPWFQLFKPLTTILIIGTIVVI